MSRQRRNPDDGACELVRAAAELGVELPGEYARAVVAQGRARGEEVQPSSLGEGVVIRTVPRTRRRLPVLLGYADHRGQWYSSGRRHQHAAQLDLVPVTGGPEL